MRVCQSACVCIYECLCVCVTIYACVSVSVLAVYSAWLYWGVCICQKGTMKTVVINVLTYTC